MVYNNLPDILAAQADDATMAAEPAAEYGDARLDLALEIDRTMRERARPAGKATKRERGDGAQRTVSLLDRNRDATNACSSWSEPAGISDRNDSTRRHRDRRDTQGSQERAPRVHPPAGHVTLVAPTGTRLEVARAYAISNSAGFATSRQDWPRRGKRRASLSSARAIIFGGRRYLLSVIRERTKKPSVNWIIAASRSPSGQQHAGEAGGGRSRLAPHAAAQNASS